MPPCRVGIRTATGTYDGSRAPVNRWVLDHRAVGVPACSPSLTSITGGTVHGPRLNGTVLAGGGDWSNTRGTVCELDTRYLIQADDGAVIDIVTAATTTREPAAPTSTTATCCSPRPGVYFRTDAPAHRWLARTVFVGLAREEDGDIVIRVYAVE
ncbi:DUF3237 domain-containing protein [Streptomyces sp. NPDC049915]|uniref:DUF3237 domain-containing protein n=1 Tax=Streptomyces sp. NPDC049915 TaxID=3155510 RepID=UPI0034288E2D